MFRKPRKPLNVGPLYAVQAALAQISALREGHTASQRQAREGQS